MKADGTGLARSTHARFVRVACVELKRARTRDVTTVRFRAVECAACTHRVSNW